MMNGATLEMVQSRVDFWVNVNFIGDNSFTRYILLVEIQSVNTQLCNFLWDKETYEHNMYILIWLLHGNRPTSPFLHYLLPTSVIYSLNASTYSLRSTDMEKVHTQ